MRPNPLALLLTAVALLPQSPAAESPPNIIVILADDLGYADLGGYGSTRNLTPHLDRLAKDGLRLTDFHSSGPMCTPTRASLLTGMYPQRVGLEKVLDIGMAGLPSQASTLPEALKKAGYRTAIFGKWHLGDLPGSNPVHHGFDVFKGHLSSETDFKSHIDRDGGHDWWDNETPDRRGGYNTELITGDTVRFIEENRDRPFFAFVSHTAIHFPWMSPMDPAYRSEGTNYNPGLVKLGPRGVDTDVSEVVKAMTESLDASTGRILEALKVHGLDERTLVIFCSDNGGYRNYQGHHEGQVSDNGPFRGQKTSVFEGGHRVPAIFRWPNRIPAGRTSDATVLTMDLMPTLLGIAGVETPPGSTAAPFDGIDLSPLLFEQKDLGDRGPVFWRLNREKAARHGDWKLVRIADAPPLLFNLKSDPGEHRDLAADHPAQVAALAQALEVWEKDVASQTIR